MIFYEKTYICSIHWLKSIFRYKVSQKKKLAPWKFFAHSPSIPVYARLDSSGSFLSFRRSFGSSRIASSSQEVFCLFPCPFCISVWHSSSMFSCSCDLRRKWPLHNIFFQVDSKRVNRLCWSAFFWVQKHFWHENCKLFWRFLGKHHISKALNLEYMHIAVADIWDMLTVQRSKQLLSISWISLRAEGQIWWAFFSMYFRRAFVFAVFTLLRSDPSRYVLETFQFFNGSIIN